MPYHEGATRFFYRRWRASAPRGAVLLLHGFGENSSYFHRLAAELNRGGFDVWGPDHVGHGLSGDHDGLYDSVDQLAANASELLAAMTAAGDDLPIFVVGHSLGGLTAIKVAAEHRGRLQALVVSGPPIAGCPERLPEKMIFSLDESYLDDARNDPLKITSADAEAGLWRTVDNFLVDMGLLTERLDMETLVIFGEKDVFTTPEQARAWTDGLPNARLMMIEGGYHDILQDVMHRELAAEIVDFLTGALSAGRRCVS